MKFSSIRNALIVVAACLFVSVVSSTRIEAKSMFSACVFSAVKGKVVKDGQPVEGAVIERTYNWSWGNEKKTDTTTTNQDGEFEMPIIERRMVMGGIMPHEPLITQEITIKVGGETHIAWRLYKSNYARNREIWFADKPQTHETPIDLLCDISKQPHKTDIGAVYYYGIGELRIP